MIARSLLLASVLVAPLAGCAASPPRVAYADPSLAEAPHLVEHDGHLFLRYRFHPDERAFAASVMVQRDEGSACFYSPGALQSSSLEHGVARERALADDGLEALGRAGALCWLDPDGTRHPLPAP